MAAADDGFDYTKGNISSTQTIEKLHTTITKAKSHALKLPNCIGFCVESPKKPSESKEYLCHFKEGPSNLQADLGQWHTFTLSSSPPTPRSKGARRSSKAKKGKKSKAQLDEERKQREADRARRDAERAKKRLTLRTKIHAQAPNSPQKVPETPGTRDAAEKEQRKKVLRFRRAQSRFALPKIALDDNAEAIALANAELEAAMNANDNDSKESKEEERQRIDAEALDAEAEKQQSKEETSAVEAEAVDAADAAEDEKSDVVADVLPSTPSDITPNISRLSVTSYASVEELTLSGEQEEALNKLQSDLEAADVDYYGFVDYKTFVSILKSNDIKMSSKHDAMLMGALTLIDEGVDYYDFARKVREVGMTLLPDNTLQDICEEIAESVGQTQPAVSEQKLPSTNLEEMTSSDIANINDEQFERFFTSVQDGGRIRGMSLANMSSITSKLNQNILAELAEDLALDGASIDMTLLKMALSTIDCDANEKDLKFLITHLCEDGSGFVDWNYLVGFLQETSRVPASKWTTGARVARIIGKVVGQVKMVERAERRRKEQEEKLKVRLEKKRASRLVQSQKGKGVDSELMKARNEEKRKRALELRNKAKGIKK